MYTLIKQFEGCELTSYYCAAGKLTIGYGNTFYKDGSPVKEGDTITKAEAEDLLAWYCREHVKLPKGEWNLKQKQALYSLAYNTGGSFYKSKCFKAIEKEEWETAFKEWNWVRAGGKILKGLQRRRKEERKLFFSHLLDVDFMEKKYYN